MKKPLAFIICTAMLISFSALLCACKTVVSDPFVTDRASTGEAEPSRGESTGTAATTSEGVPTAPTETAEPITATQSGEPVTETPTVDPVTGTPTVDPVTGTPTVSPDSDPFYSMSLLENYEKYLNYYDFDGKYVYEFEIRTYKKSETRTGTFDIPYRYPLGEPEKKAYLCTDPMCTHEPGSGCVFENVKNIWCAMGKVFFTTGESVFDVNTGRVVNESGLYAFNADTGKAIELKTGIGDLYCVCDDRMYCVGTVTNDDFSVDHPIFRVNDDLSLSQIVDVDSPFGWVDRPSRWIDERYFIFKSTLDDMGMPSQGKHQRIAIYDVQTGEIQMLFDKNKDGSDASVLEVYGKVLLIGDRSKKPTEYLLYNVETKEFRHLECDSLAYLVVKPILYAETRTTADDPLVYHVLYPATGVEEVYDLSALVGEKLDLSLRVSAPERGAVKLYYMEEINARTSIQHYVYEIDLQSGRVRAITEERLIEG